MTHAHQNSRARRRDAFAYALIAGNPFTPVQTPEIAGSFDPRDGS
jgi:hypothetical protein